MKHPKKHIPKCIKMSHLLSLRKVFVHTFGSDDYWVLPAKPGYLSIVDHAGFTIGLIDYRKQPRIIDLRKDVKTT